MGRGAVVLLLALTTGCSAPDAPPGWTIGDSAGVEIVVNERVPDAWELPPGPVLELGAADGGGGQELYRVRDVALLPDGGLVVANQGSEELRFFDDAGRFRGAVGGRGHGPVEFDGLMRVDPFGDSLLVWDAGNQRLSVRTLDGTLVRTFRLEWFDGILFPVALLQGRRTRILAVTARYMSQLGGDGLVIDTALVSIYDMDGALVDSIGRIPHNARAVQRVGDRQTTLGAPYTAGGAMAPSANGEGFCHTFGPAPEIRCRDAAGVRRLIRVPLPVRPVTDAHVERYGDEASRDVSDRRRDALRRMRETMPFPAEFPAFDALLRDLSGRLWARRYRTPDAASDEWLVFEEGRWTGRLETPVGYRVMDVRGDRLAGVWRDELGVEHVRVYSHPVK